jgi:hypothetical protein
MLGKFCCTPHHRGCQLISNPATKVEWQISAANEFGHLTQGISGHIKGTNTIQWIPHAELQQDDNQPIPDLYAQYGSRKRSVVTCA